jgi:hypothetical protein
MSALVYIQLSIVGRLKRHKAQKTLAVITSIPTVLRRRQ